MIIEFIESLFQTGLCSSRSGVLSYLANYGITYNIHGDLVQFSYDLFAADWSVPMTHFCRGLIVEWPENKKRPVYLAQPFRKFFNFGEKYSIFKTDEDVKSFVENNGELVQKADGTCIILYHNGKGWTVSTLGSIPTGNCGDSQDTFAERFWKLFDFPVHELSVGATYIFELCTEDNMVVTSYDTDRLYFLSALHNWYVIKYGVSCRRLQEFVESGKTKNIFLPKTLNVPKTISSIEEMDKFIIDNFSSGLGKNPEGVVGTINGLPVFKWKFKEYLILHKTMTGDDRCVKKRLVYAFFEGKLDDIYSDLTDSQKEFCDRLKLKMYSISRFMYKLATRSFIEGMSKSEFARSYQVNVAKMKTTEGYEPECDAFVGYGYSWFEKRFIFSEYMLSSYKGKVLFESKVDLLKAV